MGQLVLEEFLGVPQSERNEFISAAEVSAAENLKWYPSLIQELEKSRKNVTSARDPKSYVGTYWDRIRVFHIVVTEEGEELYWALQGLESEKFQLIHFEDDAFTSLQPRNELSRRGRWVGPDQGPLFWKVEFKVDEKGIIGSLFWAHDSGVPAMEFRKE